MTIIYREFAIHFFSKGSFFQQGFSKETLKQVHKEFLNDAKNSKYPSKYLEYRGYFIGNS